MILLNKIQFKKLSLKLFVEKQMICYVLICLENLRVLMNEPQGAFFIYFKHVYVL